MLNQLNFLNIFQEPQMKVKTILTTGCFATIHPGHIELLEYAATLGNVVVGINTDNYLLKKHGEVKIPLLDRIYLLKSIRYVNHVVTFTEEDACELIRKIRPHIFLKGPDYKDVDIPEKEMCKCLSIKYLIAPQTKRYNTSDLFNLNKLKV